MGDTVHNLRSALDHVVYLLAESHSTLTPEIEEALMFPIVGNQNSKGAPANGADIFRDVEARRLSGVPGPARDFIKQEQPYHWGTNYTYHWFWFLHELNRIDKHRRIVVTTAFLDFHFLSVPTDVQPRVTWTRAEGPVKDGDPLVTYSGADVGVGAHFTRDVALDEGSAAEYGLVSLMRAIHDPVEWMVRTLEEFI